MYLEYQDMIFPGLCTPWCASIMTTENSLGQENTDFITKKANFISNQNWEDFTADIIYLVTILR